MRALLFAAGLLFQFAPTMAPARESQSALLSPLGAPADPMRYFNDRQAATRALDAGDYAAAEPILTRLTANYALDPDTWLELATVHRQLGNQREAIGAYQRVIDLAGPGYGRSRVRIARLRAALGDVSGALADLEALVFREAYLERPELLEDEAFANLRGNERFLSLAGQIDTIGLSRSEGWRMDLDFLVDEIRRLTAHYRGKADDPRIEALHDELYRNVDRLSDEQMYAGMARLVGLLHQNHTMMWGIAPGSPPPSRPAFTYLPLQLYFFPEGVFVVGASDAQSELIGARLISIDGTAVLDVFARVREAMSVGGAAEAIWSAPLRMIDVALLRGLDLVGGDDRVSLRLRLPGGREVTRYVTPTPTPIVGKLPPPHGAAAPAFLSRGWESHWLETWPDLDAVYAQINQIRPDRDETMAQFGLRLRAALSENGARHLVIDLRNNNGGDTSTYAELLRTAVTFSAQQSNRVYVLIGRNTYSAAANLATDLERLANPVFIGEPSGGFGNQEGDEGSVRLPYSGLRATVAGVRWQLGDPWDERRSVTPHVPVQLTAAAYFSGADPALDLTRRLIASFQR